MGKFISDGLLDLTQPYTCWRKDPEYAFLLYKCECQCQQDIEIPLKKNHYLTNMYVWIIVTFFFSFRFLLFTLFLVVQILLFLIRHYLKNAVVPVKLSPDLYFLKPKDVYHKYKTSLLVQNSTGKKQIHFN